ncbi:hypothetical protein F383_36253 [Gossypium arboreum]|uniref:Uncharacterized protein n=1 Tax=Gossypium arboreum TaxID=29729 RepID=A0A0B0N812_GOSAR|nr:hypothetical protein F383_36253 [Gossypium arboreum]
MSKISPHRENARIPEARNRVGSGIKGVRVPAGMCTGACAGVQGVGVVPGGVYGTGGYRG